MKKQPTFNDKIDVLRQMYSGGVAFTRMTPDGPVFVKNEEIFKSDSDDPDPAEPDYKTFPCASGRWFYYRNALGQPEALLDETGAAVRTARMSADELDGVIDALDYHWIY